jgi:integrase
VTFSDYSKTWERVQVSSEGTRRIVDNALRLHLRPALGDRRMSSVRRSDVQGFVKLLEGKGLSAGSVRNVYRVAAQVFAAAVEDRVIASSPCRRVPLPKDDKGEIAPLTVAQVSAVVSAAEARYRAAVVTLAGSGLRIGELLGLAVSDVDFLRRTIRVERQRMQSGRLDAVKSRTSRRTVPVGQVVIDGLAAHLAARPSDDALFTDEIGRPLTYPVWKVLWKAATEKASVDATAHDLRHFYASALIAGGASVKQVQTVLGHSSAVITLRTYAHLWPGDDDRTRDVIDLVLSPLADCARTEAVSDA